jgi:hypothetical protein
MVDSGWEVELRREERDDDRWNGDGD